MSDTTRRHFLYATGGASVTVGGPTKVRASDRCLSTPVLPLDGAEWQVAMDPHNSGREWEWFQGPTSETRPARVPSVIQDVFPDYHGVAWYWREFNAPANAHDGGRYLLRFHMVDYRAEVWVNGKRVGMHEDGREPFAFDVTETLRPNAANKLAVRVLNPTHDPIDAITLATVASGRRQYPKPVDNAYNTGGIARPVELHAVPAVSFQDLHFVPGWETGDVRVDAMVQNSSAASRRIDLGLLITPAAGGECLEEAAVSKEVRPDAAEHLPRNMICYGGQSR